jgi:diguanylate cyclase (GGDEF)-like protein
VGTNDAPSGNDFTKGDQMSTQVDVVALLAENERLKQEVEQLRIYRTIAYSDPLTELFNRRYFDRRLGEEIDRVGRRPGSELSVMVIDLDGFKRINDEQGHAAGDAVLRKAANILSSTLRQHDVCCRIGGDEFAVLLPNANALGAHLLAQRLKQALAAAGISASFGAATHGPNGARADVLLASADAAMYRDKRKRKTSPQTTSERTSRLRMLANG